MKEFVERFFVTQLGAELPGWAKALVSLTNVFLILLVAWGLLTISGRLLHLLDDRMRARSVEAEERKRIETLMRVSRYVASVLIGAITVMLILSEVGISIAPILATAGVAGLAVGFGAQSLVKDYFTGFVMLIENQIRVGDMVEVGGKSGLVEEVTLRYVRLRDVEGAVHYVPNGIIATVTNKSREFAYAVSDIGVGYDQDTDRIFDIIRKVSAEMAESPAFAARILEPIMGVDQFADSAVTIRCRIKVVALEQGPVRREFLRRLKKAFDAEGIEIPFPSRTVYTKNGSL
jgi:small conductance mechanosensitive channel